MMLWTTPGPLYAILDPSTCHHMDVLPRTRNASSINPSLGPVSEKKPKARASERMVNACYCGDRSWSAGLWGAKDTNSLDSVPSFSLQETDVQPCIEAPRVVYCRPIFNI
ncbi:hypothetical protein EWB00_000855 [Schistosoma japonicum]|uniref:Uncharacterized protein n=1 Tax=Schistosoma japonicum TaxID=6182 RepID=A0A4Z2CK75_SCHJA|nr:hypothetical protein EWB00_000855 [Schistosoma japonicum]